MDASLWLYFLFILLLIVASGFFSGSETALTAASRARIHRLAEDGNSRAIQVERLINNKEEFIGTVLLGNNVVNILASSLATFFLTQMFGEAGVVYATAGMTILVIIFAEVLPKTYAISRPDRVALFVAPMFSVLTRLAAPLVAIVQKIVRGVLNLFGAHITDSTSFLSAHEEIRGTIDLHASEGALVAEHKHMLGSILDLDDVLVSDVMKHRKSIEMIDIDDRPEDIVQAAIRSSFTRLPLYRDNPENIIGVLHAKDLIRALAKRGAEPETLRIDQVARKPWFVPNTTTLREQLNAFIAQRVHFALVVDEYGALQGLITLEDILEEIVGDISDEHDLPTPPGVRIEPDGALLVEGVVTLRDLNRRFDWRLPDEEAATIAGLVIDQARIIPVKGQRFEFFGFVFEVLERRRNQITRLRIVPPTPILSLAADDAAS